MHIFSKWLILAAGCTLLTSCTQIKPKVCPKYFHVDLKDSMNMDLQDQDANDGKGGWFDDGESDLRYFLVQAPESDRPAIVNFSGIPYKIIDPKKNDHRGVVVFGSAEKPQIKLRKIGPLPVDRKAAEIWLLHAVGWGKKNDKVAEITLNYSDGTKHSFSLFKQINVGDWYRPQPIPEGNIAWRGYSPITDNCGIYATCLKNPFPQKNIKNISVRGGYSKVLYALLAMTLSAEETKDYKGTTTFQNYQEISKRPVPEPVPQKDLNPLKIPGYAQTLTVEFASKEAAEKAQIKVSPLPFGKYWAFTLRWDDCASNHLTQAKLMKKHGLRGTFFLTGFNSNYAKIARQFKDYGCTVGNHTVRHVDFRKISYNCAFEMIMRQQILIESELDSVSVGFVYPGGMSRGTPEMMQNTARCLNASGIYSTPESNPAVSDILKLGKRKYFPTYLFSSNDRAPDEKLFISGMRWAKALSSMDPDVPRISFGLHDWMTPEGYKVLDGIYQRHAHDLQFWNANENEYAAYRYSYYNANPVKTVMGTTVIFQITRFEPAFLGAETPLEVAFTEKPKDVVLNGKNIPPDQYGRYLLSHNPGHWLPKGIEHLAEANNISKKFPGISAEVMYDSAKKQFTVKIGNQTQELFKNVYITLILPPRWENMTTTQPVLMIQPGATMSFAFPEGNIKNKAAYQDKDYLITAKIDFSGNKYSGRIYKTITLPAK